MSAELVILVNLLLYFIGFSFLLFKRNTLSEQSVGLLSISINVVGVLFSMGLTANNNTSYAIHADWFKIGTIVFTVDILLNELTFLIYFLVQFIALWVQVFSLKYMSGDSDFGRYYAYINLFVLAMLGIVISGNLLMIYIFWELVGLCSYLLIGFWYEKTSATNAAKKAFLVNRVGDVGFLIGIFLVYRYFGTFEITLIAEKAKLLSASTFQSPVFTTIGLLLFCGCVAKSAQLPLQVWLPDAMEGPTPVSALIHAATMVAAGIFLMARIFPILNDDALLVMAVVGITTALFGAFSAINQYDIKKLLAYSTISQLGLMVVGLGTGAVNAALFHLVTHAFFKAGLFLSAGAVIHYTHHQQDMRQMGNLRLQMPFIFYGYSICAAALAGIPLFSGFLSKDAIIVAAFDWASQQSSVMFYIIPLACLVVSGLSAFYMTRQVYLIFMDRDDNPIEIISSNVMKFYKRLSRRIEGIVKVDDEHKEEDKLTIESFYEAFSEMGPMEWSILVLAIASFGLIFSVNPFYAESSWFFESFPHHSESFHWIAYVAVLVTAAGIWQGYKYTKEESATLDKFKTQPDGVFNRLIFHNFYLSEFYQTVFVNPIVSISSYIHKFDVLVIDGLVNLMAKLMLLISGIVSWFEQNIVDAIINFIAITIGKLGSYTRQIQNGKAQTYIITIFVCLVLIIYFLMV